MRIRCVTAAARRWSVDVEHGFAADSAVQQGVERWGGFVPGALELKLAVEAAGGDEGAQTGQVTGSAGVRGGLIKLVQRR
jgi:hypothetical protein